MKLEDVVSFVNETVPFPFYANDFPKSEKEDCGFVRIEGGAPPDKYILGLKSPSIQIVVRHERGSEAERIANEVWKLFHGKEHFMIGDSKIYFTSCDQSEPIHMDKDKNGRTIYSVNVSCKLYE